MKVPLWLVRLGLVVGGGALLIVATVVAIAPRLWATANAHEEVPVVLPEFEPLAQRSYVYDSDGREIAIFELENSQPIDYDDIPSHVIQAFLVVEDKEFFNHDGINVRSLVRATLSNFASDAPQQGASTITMQVVKNDFLAGLERDGRYKLLQIHYARMLENAKSKEEILERYLNTVFFGNNAYGIQAAAETYFGKTAADLSFVEAAFLAGLVRSPSGFDPINAPERSRARWIQVVDRIFAEGLITEEQVPGLEQFPIPERVKSIPTRANKRTYFTEAVRDYLLNRTSILGETYEERYNRLFRGGLRIYTTLDQTMQGQAEQARSLLPDTEEGFDAAVVTLDVETGGIRAMVGGRGFIPGEREVNMALAPRQTGSSIKAFILAAAVQAGAEGTDLIDGTRPCRLPNPGDPSTPFEITDARNLGVAPLAEHTAKSINCAYAKLSQMVGLNRVVDTTYRMSSSAYLYQGQPERERTPLQPFASLATGANEMSPLDMAAGMQTLANNGVHRQPFFVERIIDADGEEVYAHFDPGTKVFDVQAALRTVDILKGTLSFAAGGTARTSALENDRPAFGKTGTQAENTNAWFVGATPQLATAVWVGDPDAYTPMVNIEQFLAEGVPRVQGGTFPAQIWKAFMDAAHAVEPVLDWEQPESLDRDRVRLVLPGYECTLTIVGYNTTTTDASSVVGDGDDGTTAEGEAGTDPGTTTTTTEPEPIYARTPVGTTIAPNNLDPLAPLPSVPTDEDIGPCVG